MEFDATFLIAAISFVLFVIIMNSIFYAPILKIIEERNKFVENNFNSANTLKNETKKQEEYHSKELEISRTEAKTILDNEMQKMNGKKSQVISEYKNELMTNISQEKENLKNSAIEAKETLKDNVVDIAKNISSIILGSNINNDTINKSQIREE